MLGPVPLGGFSEEGGEYTGSLGSEQSKPEIGCPSPGILCGGDKPPLGHIEGLGEAWIWFMRRVHTSPRIRAERSLL